MRNIMKTLLSIFIVLMVTIACRSQQNIPVTVSWQEDITAVEYRVFIWTGSTANTPLVEDATIGFIDSLGLPSFTVIDSVGIFEIVFMSVVNGDYIQAAGFTVDQSGQSLGASLTALKRKPFGGTKMSGINLTF